MSKHLRYFILFIVLLLFAEIHLWAQAKDFESWNTIEIKKSINEKFAVKAEQELRVNQNASALKKYIAVFGTEYMVCSYLKVKAHYRLTYNWDLEDGNTLNSRLYFDLQTKYKIHRFKFKFRERYQYKMPTYGSKEFALYPFHHLRHKLSIAYNIPNSKMEPFGEIELYQSLNNPVQNGIDKQRYTLGIELPIDKRFSMSVFYRYQKRNDYYRKPLKSYILGAEISIDL